MTKKAIELYNPQNIVIATVFYTKRGIEEIKKEISTAQIYAYGIPDELNDDGMLIPGCGNLDARIKI